MKKIASHLISCCLGLLCLLTAASASAVCTTPDGTAGEMVYNEYYCTMQYCNDTNWIAIGAGDCAANPDPCATVGPGDEGTTCSDGSKYAGDHPVNGNPMFVPAADDSSGVAWNKGAYDPFTTGVNNGNDGAANTATLVGLTDVGAPYQAAQLCNNSTAHGRGDWYLPAQNELVVIYNHKAVITGFNTSGTFPAGYYWASTEADDENGGRLRFSDGWNWFSGKVNVLSVRCARQN